MIKLDLEKGHIHSAFIPWFVDVLTYRYLFQTCIYFETIFRKFAINYFKCVFFFTLIDAYLLALFGYNYEWKQSNRKQQKQPKQRSKDTAE